jgi:hypothetical protein
LEIHVANNRRSALSDGLGDRLGVTALSMVDSGKKAPKQFIQCKCCTREIHQDRASVEAHQ